MPHIAMFSVGAHGHVNPNLPVIAEVYAAILDNPADEAYQARFAAWLDEQEIRLSVEEFIGRPPRCIVLIPRALQPHAEKVDEAVYTFVGALAGRPAAPR